LSRLEQNRKAAALRYCVVGAGFSGAVIGRALAQAGHQVLVVDERAQIGGNCYTERDRRTGVMVHKYGPHIFHTAEERVWTYLQRFGEMTPYGHRVQAMAGGAVYSFPVNLLTINQFFRSAFNPAEAQAFIAGKARKVEQPSNFEEQALGMIGEELYRAFFRGYTRKQWGVDPKELPASILKRLPLRFDYNDSYFSHPYQAIPRNGYTAMAAAILNAPNLELRLGACFEQLDEKFSHVIYSGPLDRFFNYRLGRLGYRTLDFDTFYSQRDYQGTAVLNYCDEEIAFTRITEHKHFAPWEKEQFEETVCYREFSRTCLPKDIPYYPIRLAEEQKLLERYIALAKETSGVTFVGRLGTYRYLDMDATVAEALNAADHLLDSISAGRPLPAFCVDPNSPGPCFGPPRIAKAA
jgi:UDP-galactopyranose mutase